MNDSSLGKLILFTLLVPAALSLCFLNCGKNDDGVSGQHPDVNSYRIYLSRDLGATWTGSDNGLSYSTIFTSFALSGNTLFGNDTYKMYLSRDDGASWLVADNGLPNRARIDLAANSSKVFVGTNLGLYCTTDLGANWSIVQDTILPGYITVVSLSIEGNNILVGTFQDGMFKSSDNGSSWSEIQTGFYKPTVYPIIQKGTDIFAGIDNQIMKSTDFGVTWNNIFSLDGSSITEIALNETSVFVSFYSNPDFRGSLYISWDYGTTFNLSNISFENNSYVIDIECYGNNIFAGVINRPMYISRDNGINWISTTSGGLPSSGSINAIFIKSDGTIFAAH